MALIGELGSYGRPGKWTVHRTIVQAQNNTGRKADKRPSKRHVWKVGHTIDLGERLDQINKHIPYEIIGEKWEVRFQQQWNTSLLAYEMEQTVFQLASAARTVGERIFCSDSDIEAVWQSAFGKLKVANVAARKGA